MLSGPLCSFKTIRYDTVNLICIMETYEPNSFPNYSTWLVHILCIVISKKMYNLHLFGNSLNTPIALSIFALNNILYPCAYSKEYWKTKLSDKFRNERKHSIDGQMKAQTKKKKLADLPVDTEDERSIDMHQRYIYFLYS